MSTLPVISPSIGTASSGPVAGKNDKADAREGFLALLDAGKQASDFNGGEGGVGNAYSGRRRKEETARVVAAPVTPALQPLADDRRGRVDDVADKAKKISLADDEGEKPRSILSPRKKDDADAHQRPEKSAHEKTPRSANDKTREATPVAANQNEAAAPQTSETEPSAETAQETASQQEAAPVNDTAETNEAVDPAAQAGLSPFGFLERLQQLMHQFFEDLNHLLTSGGGIDAIVTLIREFHAGMQQALADAQAQANAPATPTTTSTLLADAPQTVASGETPVATDAALPGNGPLSAEAAADSASPQTPDIAPVLAGPANEKGEGHEKAAVRMTDTPAAIPSPVMDRLAAFAALATETPQKSAKPETETNVAAQVAAQDAPKLAAANNSSNNAQPNVAAPVNTNASEQHNAGAGGGQRDAQNHSQQPGALSAVQGNNAARQSEQASGPTFARLLSPSTQAQVIEQVKIHIKTAIRDGSSDIRVQLRPEELGRLDIRIHINAEGKTMLAITADNRDTYELLQRDSRSLEQALADAGLKSDAGSLSFNLRGGQQHDREHASGRALPVIPAALLEEEPVDLGIVSRSYQLDIQEGLDIKI